MPKFLEKKLEKEYPGDEKAVFGTMNKIGAMKGNKETKKGEAMEKKHDMAKKMKGRCAKCNKKHDTKDHE